MSTVKVECHTVAFLPILLIAVNSVAAADSASTRVPVNSRYLLAQPNATGPVIAVTVPPAPQIAGTRIAYDVTLTNPGPGDMARARVVDFLPRGCSCCIETHDVSDVSATQTAGPPFSCGGVSFGTTECDARGVFAAGASASFRFEMTLSSYLASHNCTYGGSNGFTVFDGSTVITSASHALNLAASADLSVDTSAPQIAALGDTIEYSIRVTNNGPSDAENVVLSDDLPPGARLVAVSGTTASASYPSVTCTMPPVGETGTVRCSVPYMGHTSWFLGAGTWASFRITVTMEAALITNSVTVVSSTSDPQPGNNTSVTTTEQLPASNIPALSPILLLCIAATIVTIAVARLR